MDWVCPGCGRTEINDRCEVCGNLCTDWICPDCGKQETQDTCQSCGHVNWPLSLDEVALDIDLVRTRRRFDIQG